MLFTDQPETTDQATTDQPDQPATTGQPVIGYVLKMYPRFSETFVVSEILAREAAGERVVIFSLRSTTDARFHGDLARVNAPVVYIPRTSTASRLWAGLQEAAQDPQIAGRLTHHAGELFAAGHDDAYQALALASAAREMGVTHLHAHLATVATTVARLAGKITGLPYSFTAHAKDIFHEDTDEELLGRKLAEAHHVVTISEYNVRHLTARFPDAVSRLHLVRNGLQLSRFPCQPERPARPGRPPRVLAVGRLVEKKGFALLIEAAARLRAAGIDIEVDIAGHGPLAAELETQIADAGLGDRVRLLGPRTQDEVIELMGTHDVFAAPFVVGRDGNADGLPTVLLEAMARGIPCVAAEVTGVGEVIRHGQTGWLLPTGDVEALSDALAEAVRGNNRAIVAAARQLVEDLFDSRRQARELRELACGPGLDGDPDGARTATSTRRSEQVLADPRAAGQEAPVVVPV